MLNTCNAPLTLCGAEMSRTEKPAVELERNVLITKHHALRSERDESGYELFQVSYPLRTPASPAYS